MPAKIWAWEDSFDEDDRFLEGEWCRDGGGASGEVPYVRADLAGALAEAATSSLNVLAMFEEPDMNTSAMHVFAQVKGAASRLRAALRAYDEASKKEEAP